MKRKIFAVVIGICFIALGACSRDGDSGDSKSSDKEPKSVSYTMEINTEGEDTTQFEYYKDGKKESFIVKEKKNGKFKTAAWMLNDGTARYIIDPDQKTAIKLSSEQGPMVGPSFPYMQWAVQPDWGKWSKEHERLSNISIKEKGKEKVRGEKCKIMEITNKTINQKIHYYVSDDNVVRRWVHFPAGPHEKKSTMDLLDYKVNKKIPAEKLSVPAGYQVQDMSQMMKQMPKMPR
jgi:outer membrane lipoprotein-sorting protein